MYIYIYIYICRYVHIYEEFFSKLSSPNLTFALQHRFLDWRLLRFWKELFMCIFINMNWKGVDSPTISSFVCCHFKLKGSLTSHTIWAFYENNWPLMTL